MIILHVKLLSCVHSSMNKYENIIGSASFIYEYEIEITNSLYILYEDGQLDSLKHCKIN